MSSDRILALMALMNEVKRPHGTYWRAVRRATETFTDSAENLAAIKRGNAALLEIETAVRQWTAKHPDPEQSGPTKLEQAAAEARAALAALCYDLEDPGSNALGALHLLTQATIGVEAQPDDAAKVLAKRDGTVLRQAAEDLMAACPEHGGADETWMDCPCEYAEELLRKADLAEAGATS